MTLNRPDRGKLLGAAELEKIEKFYRYFDKDGDGIPIGLCPGRIPRARISPVAPDTHSTAPIPRTLSNTRSFSTGC